jgi:L-alanine-DL-glutamate epimerase-like enolase superfamily enzyme
MPWFAPLFREKIEIKNGMVEIPNRPGTGFTFDLNKIEEYRI